VENNIEPSTIERRYDVEDDHSSDFLDVGGHLHCVHDVQCAVSVEYMQVVEVDTSTATVRSSWTRLREQTRLLSTCPQFNKVCYTMCANKAGLV